MRQLRVHACAFLMNISAFSFVSEDSYNLGLRFRDMTWLYIYFFLNELSFL